MHGPILSLIAIGLILVFAAAATIVDERAEKAGRPIPDLVFVVAGAIVFVAVAVLIAHSFPTPPA